jgi:NAD(P)-dependent dehydrogenase (short-subunit alcohol dehydrogenase family)
VERRVLVTGAASGIGLATVLHLAEMGFSPVGLVRDGDGAAELREAAAAHHAEVGVVVADLSDDEARASALQGLEPWALVNNAGYLDAGRVLDVPIDEARRQLEAMVLAPVQLVQAVVPAMIRRGEGRIVNVTSAAVHAVTPYSGWYQASKAALRELNDALRLELAGYGIEVVDIEPGGMWTGIWLRGLDELSSRRGRSERPGSYDRAIRLVERVGPRLPGPEQVAEAIGEVLSAGRPPLHRRVGRDAAALRTASEVVPDRLLDKLLASRPVNPVSRQSRRHGVAG